MCIFWSHLFLFHLFLCRLFLAGLRGIVNIMKYGGERKYFSRWGKGPPSIAESTNHGKLKPGQPVTGPGKTIQQNWHPHTTTKLEALVKKPRATLCGDRRGRGAKTRGFLRFLRCSRNPLRESAWSSWLFATELVLGSCLVVRAPAPGTGGSRVRFLPGPRAGVARCNLHFKAT